MTIYLSNWSSHKTPGHHGPGRKLTIMRIPRRWEQGAGRVIVLMPALRNLNGLHDGSLPMDAYRFRYESAMESALLAGNLDPIYTTAGGGTAVMDGDTLCCVCSRAAASRNECHRVWAARALKEAGWDVVLDGVAL